MEQTPGTPKALMAVVIGMGLLIVVGTVTLVGVIIHRMGAHSLPSGATRFAPAVPLQDEALLHPALPAGARLISMARVQDGLLALHITDNGQDRILLWQVGMDHLIPGVESSATPAKAEQ